MPTPVHCVATALLLYLAGGDFLIDAHVFRGVEWRVPGGHLVDENPC